MFGVLDDKKSKEKREVDLKPKLISWASSQIYCVIAVDNYLLLSYMGLEHLILCKV